ncbi:hypothetical protein B0H17DRAFT_1039467 [Mycena rosella]|uniref:Uncharacterized protein n=1 Tax=Mycena rosella TaxID=1033263 RepID=A0AAD7M792_MYCRO|nr:hypothetical protein B0H17DRAFT_1039467 [Mycena rosella]
MAQSASSNYTYLERSSLKSLHLSIDGAEDSAFLLATVNHFSTSALTNLRIDYTHGDQICWLFDSTTLSDSSFPSLTSLSFANVGKCPYEQKPEIYSVLRPIPSPPLRRFPILSSLTLINQCFTTHIIEQILGLGPESAPWPLLKTLTLCPQDNDMQAVHRTLQNLERSKRREAQTIPKFRFSPKLFSHFLEPYSNWDEHQVDVEWYDATEVLAALE